MDWWVEHLEGPRWEKVMLWSQVLFVYLHFRMNFGSLFGDWMLLYLHKLYITDIVPISSSLLIPSMVFVQKTQRNFELVGMELILAICNPCGSKKLLFDITISRLSSVE